MEAVFDWEEVLDVSALVPQASRGTLSKDGVGLSEVKPNPNSFAPDRAVSKTQVLEWMDLHPGTPMEEVQIDAVFLSSCTNTRIKNIRHAAAIVVSRRVSPGSERW